MGRQTGSRRCRRGGGWVTGGFGGGQQGQQGAGEAEKACPPPSLGLRGFGAKFAPFQLGTACSGTDIIHRVFGQLQDHWKHTYDVDMSVSECFACESDAAKRSFLMSQHNTPFVFEKVEDLTKHKVLNLKDQAQVFVPFVDGFACGFSCTARSPANPNSKKNVNCIQRNMDTSTNLTFDGAMSYVEKAHPELVWLESIKELEHESEDCPRSDAQEIIARLEAMDYTADCVKFDAVDFGSWAKRLRLYFIAMAGNSPENRARMTLLKKFLAAMEIGPGSGDEVHPACGSGIRKQQCRSQLSKR